jgi:methyl-accepting chemotaxis protein
MKVFFEFFSAKNKIWGLSTAILLFSSFYCAGIVFYEKVFYPYNYLAYIFIFLYFIIFVILNAVILKKSSKKIEIISEKIKEMSTEGIESLKDIKENLGKFITLSGSQLDQLKESSKLMESISDMLINTTKNSAECKDISDKVTRDVSEGNQIMQKMVEAVLTIEKTKDGLSEISVLIHKISDDTSAIHNIVSTTELLSLNASIEAARAGETGKGFSVVAEEVGELAKHSGIEANEIENIVALSQQKIKSLIEANQSRVEVGKIASKEALAVFASIKEEMFGISSRSENIRAATWEQKLGIDQLNSGSHEIKNILKKNITDTVNLIKIYSLNENNFKNIEKISSVLEEFWNGKSRNESGV